MTTLLKGMQPVRPRFAARFHHDVAVDPLPAPALMLLVHNGKGVTFDVSDRVDFEEIDSIEESVEEDLTQFTHGDIEVTIKDPDGAFERFLLGDALAVGYTIEILRERVFRSRLVWERVFAGVLDQPWSITIDPKAETVSVRAFSYSKLLDQTSAETVARSITGKTGTVSAGSAVVTLSPDASGVDVGDKLKLTKPEAEEEHTVIGTTASTATVDANFTNAFSAATAAVTNPWHRNKSIEFLAGEIFKAAGISLYDVRLADLDNDPFPSPAFRASVDTTYKVYTLTVKGGKLRITLFQAPLTDDAYDTPDARTGWTFRSASDNYYADWSPYLSSEPATILKTDTFTPREDERDIGSSRSASGGANGKARPCWDHGGGHVYSWDINAGNSRLWRDGVNQGVIESTIGTSAIFLEYDPINDYIWYSRCRSTGSLLFGYIPAPGPAGTTVTTSVAGKMRYLQGLRLLAMHEHTDNITPTSTISIWDPATKTQVHELTLPSAEIEIWTMRTNGTHVAVLYKNGGQWRCIVWRYPGWAVVGDFGVGGSVTDDALMTVHKDPVGGALQFFAFAGGSNNPVVLAPWYAGIVPEADFEGESCADALADLATLAGATSLVDVEKVGSLKNRIFLDEAKAPRPIVIDRPLTRTIKPVWEGYRTRTVVSFTDAAGNDHEIIGGSKGDSSRSLDIDTKLVKISGQAEWLAARLSSFFGAVRAEEEIEIFETGPVHVGDRLVLSGKKYLVIESEHALLERRQTLRIVEL